MKKIQKKSLKNKKFGGLANRRHRCTVFFSVDHTLLVLRHGDMASCKCNQAGGFYGLRHTSAR